MPGYVWRRRLLCKPHTGTACLKGISTGYDSDHTRTSPYHCMATCEGRSSTLANWLRSALTRNMRKGLSRNRQTCSASCCSAGSMASNGVSASSPAISTRLGPPLRSIIIENIQYCTRVERDIEEREVDKEKSRMNQMQSGAPSPPLPTLLLRWLPLLLLLLRVLGSNLGCASIRSGGESAEHCAL